MTDFNRRAWIGVMLAGVIYMAGFMTHMLWDLAMGYGPR